MQVVKIKNINKSYMQKPFAVKGRIKCNAIEPNKHLSGSHLYAILFDDSSEIEVVAFKNCEKILKLLQKNNVVSIENGVLREVNKDYKKTKHKYKILLESNTLITIINNDEVNIVDFPLHKYTSGAELKTLTTGMIVDIVGVCIQIDSNKTFNAQNQIIRRGKISVDSIPFDVRFSGDKVDELYNLGRTLLLTSVKYINYTGYEHLSVGSSSSVQYYTQKLSNSLDMKQLQQLERIETFFLDSKIELPKQKLSTSSISQSYRNSVDESIDQRPSTSGSTPSNKNLVDESIDQKPSTSGSTPSNKISDLVDESIDQKPSTSGSTSSNKNLVDESIDQKPSTSGSTPSNKRKTQDKGEEVNSKIQKRTESDVTFSDERFVNMVINFMQTVNSNKNIVQLRILEFISNMLKENKK